MAAKDKDVPVAGFDAGTLELVTFPFRVTPANLLTTDQLRLEVNTAWPFQVRNKLGFTFAKMNELELTHNGSAALAMVVADLPKPKDSPVFIRGQPDVRGPVVPRRFLEVLSHGKPQPFKKGSGRLELAQCIASKDNPLTARVLVNRVWMHHFGQGIVRTPDDLGNQSGAPSHPELLDYLASRFMEDGWSLKKLHRLIMLSNVYRQSSETNPKYEVTDPDNVWLWRANIRRLDFEAIRDSLLVLSGDLDPTLGGQPVNLTAEPYSYRRSVYGYIDRGNLPELMTNFDFSDPQMPNSKRDTTVVPQQALFLMNSPMVIDVVRKILVRPDIARSRTNQEAIFNIYRVIFQRTPKPAEIQLWFAFVANEIKEEPKVAAAAKAMTEKANKKLAEQKKRDEKAEADTSQNAGLRAIQNEGRYVERKPLTPWETYIHALLLTNELAYVH